MSARRARAVLFLLALVAGRLDADREPAWESAWESSLAFAFGGGTGGAPFAGIAAKAGFSELTALRLRLAAVAGLRALSEGEEAPSVMPWAGLCLGRDFPLGRWVVVSPLLSAELRFPLDTSPMAPALGFAAGASVGLRLAGRVLLLLSGEVSFSATGSTPAFVSVSVGARRGLVLTREQPSVSAETPEGGRELGGTDQAATDEHAKADEQPRHGTQPGAEELPVVEGDQVAAPTSVPGMAPLSERAGWRLGTTLFSPDDDGQDDSFVVDIQVDEPELLASWRFEVLDDAGDLFYATGGEGAPPGRLTWDGRSGDGELVEPAREYAVVLTLAESGGEAVTLAGSVLVDILVIKDGDKYRIRLPAIEFLPDSDAVGAQSTGAELLEQNRLVLTKLAEILRRFPGYSILIEGHANAVHWEDPAQAAVEQRDELVPLSLRRAEAVKDALATLGIESSRMSTVGRGAATPLVPFSDLAQSGRNRRVEVILVR